MSVFCWDEILRGGKCQFRWVILLLLREEDDKDENNDILEYYRSAKIYTVLFCKLRKNMKLYEMKSIYIDAF